ncbi:uncharacterized protein PITG_17630 [Phytophthora infestans T30-4]|uniref:Polycystin cation channel PKD1/PKD2 domain-containing protein n=1 Tax=Phytophthora infestans (strain T30-4) TaxID=403677 RepID=D0NWU2_PHYIT|nr:uncharacterized protein PITG_17630 [Phytophthora infestans T30-4]EEY67525.1 conserved hypothetical protein [Phytophthora infestans T30-4]|eukprot:XP_002896498.1 conserved hypothetical protein [Phytophthora infestans T30-4]
MLFAHITATSMYEQDTFVPSVFITQDYNGKTYPKDLWGRVATFNKVLGAVNFQVTRKATHTFDTPAIEALGKINAFKVQGDWLDFPTEELLIIIVAYNGELQGYAVTEMQLTLSEGGSSLATAADIVVLIFFLFALDTQLRKLYRYRRSGIGKLGCGDVWVVIEHSSTVAVAAFCFVILTRTVASALHQFGVFFIVFVVIFATFAVSGAILFGDRVEEFSSLETATETCTNMLFGNFDYNSIQGLYALVCEQ